MTPKSPLNRIWSLPLDRRQLGVTPKMSAVIAACSDAAKLDLWLDRAIVAASASEVFKRGPREGR